MQVYRLVVFYELVWWVLCDPNVVLVYDLAVLGELVLWVLRFWSLVLWVFRASLAPE